MSFNQNVLSKCDIFLGYSIELPVFAVLVPYSSNTTASHIPERWTAANLDPGVKMPGTGAPALMKDDM